jgi:hypothetical protein
MVVGAVAMVVDKDDGRSRSEDLMLREKLFAVEKRVLFSS